MELSYDVRCTIADIRPREKTVQGESIHIGDEPNVDLAPDGTVYGIELVNANEQLRAGDGGRLVVVDEAQGDERELALGSGTRP